MPTGSTLRWAWPNRSWSPAAERPVTFDASNGARCRSLCQGDDGSARAVERSGGAVNLRRTRLGCAQEGLLRRPPSWRAHSSRTRSLDLSGSPQPHEPRARLLTPTQLRQLLRIMTCEFAVRRDGLAVLRTARQPSFAAQPLEQVFDVHPSLPPGNSLLFDLATNSVAGRHSQSDPKSEAKHPAGYTRFL